MAGIRVGGGRVRCGLLSENIIDKFYSPQMVVTTKYTMKKTQLRKEK